MSKLPAGRSRLATILLGVLLLAGVAGGLAPATTVAQNGACWTTPPSMAQGFPQWTTPPQMVIDPSGAYTATIETNRGTMGVQLLADQAPATVNNFVCLALAGYYDVTVFHRIMAGFMIQGGDPTGTGAGGPGYQFADELPTTQSPYTRGTVAMANAGPNTNGSQFFIVHQDQPPTFPSNYAIFGRVTEGLDVLDTIASAPVTVNARGEESSPLATIGIKTITITDASGNVLAADIAVSTPVAGASPVAGVATAQATVVPTMAPESTATPAVANTTEDDDDDSNLALWIAGGVAIAAGVGYWLWSQRRRPAASASRKPTARSGAAASTGATETATPTSERPAQRPTAPKKKANRRR